MGFKINEENKIRLSFSQKACIVMEEDMRIFHVERKATFINQVFANFYEEAKSSLSLHRDQREMELDRLFGGIKTEWKQKEPYINAILDYEERQIKEDTSVQKKDKVFSMVVRINEENTKSLEEGYEDEHYKNPASYVQAVIEEYCKLPFIERERIYRKEIYEVIQKAMQEKKVLRVRAMQNGEELKLTVYPYRIVADAYHTQSYLVCYSREEGKSDTEKIVASFNMSRIEKPKLLGKTFYLNKKEIANIEYQISKYSPAYLIAQPENIKVKLTKKGQASFQTRILLRPEKIEEESTEDVYVFDCTQQEIFNYFISFGPEAEILEPESLRNRFKDTFERARDVYRK